MNHIDQAVLAWTSHSLRLSLVPLFTVVTIALMGCAPSRTNCPTPISIADIVHLEARFGDLDPTTRARVSDLLIEGRNEWVEWRRDRDRRSHAVRSTTPDSPASAVVLEKAIADLAQASYHAFESIDNAWIDRFARAVADSAWGDASEDAVRLLRTRRAMERPLASLRPTDARIPDVRAFLEGTLAPLSSSTSALLAQHETAVAERLRELAHMTWAPLQPPDDPASSVLPLIGGGDLHRLAHLQDNSPAVKERTSELVAFQTAFITGVASTLTPLDSAALTMTWYQALVGRSRPDPYTDLARMLFSGMTRQPAEHPTPGISEALRLIALARREDATADLIAAATSALEHRRIILEEMLTLQADSSDSLPARSGLRTLRIRLSEHDDAIRKLVSQYPDLAPDPAPPPAAARVTVAPWAQPGNRLAVFVEQQLSSIESIIDALPRDRKVTDLPAFACTPGLLTSQEAFQFELARQLLATPRVGTLSATEAAACVIDAVEAATRNTFLAALALGSDDVAMPVVELFASELIWFWLDSESRRSPHDASMVEVPLSAVILSLPSDDAGSDAVTDFATRQRVRVTHHVTNDLLPLFADSPDLIPHIALFYSLDPIGALKSVFDVAQWLDDLQGRYADDTPIPEDDAAALISMLTSLRDAIQVHFATQAATLDAAADQGLLPHAQLDRLEQILAEWSRLYVAGIVYFVQETLVRLGIDAEHPSLEAFRATAERPDEKNFDPNPELEAVFSDLKENLDRQSSGDDSVVVVNNDAAFTEIMTERQLFGQKDDPSSPSSMARAESIRRVQSAHRDARLELEALLPNQVTAIRECEAKTRFGLNLDQHASSFKIALLEEALYLAAQDDPQVASIWTAWRNRMPELLVPMLIGADEALATTSSSIRFEFDLGYAEALLVYRDTLVGAIRDAAACCQSPQLALSLRRSLLEVPFAGDVESWIWE